MSLTPVSKLTTAALRAEIWRRQQAGLPPHRRLTHVSSDALNLEVAQRDYAAQNVTWFPPVDDRKDPFSTSNLPAPLLAHAARSCYLISAGAVQASDGDTVRLHHLHYGSANSLCASEPFWSQPSVVERLGEAYGSYGYSGYLLDSRHVLTCWHGWEAFSRAAQVAVFDYCVHGADDNPTRLAKRSVYGVKLYPRAIEPANSRKQGCPGDWVILELDRPVDHLGPVKLPVLATPSLGAAVYTLGYPCGLPLKLADGASILHLSDGEFRADLDTFTGNSGSPVFDAMTHALLGIVIEAQKDEGDFEPAADQRCYVSNRVDSRISGQRVSSVACLAAELTQLGKPHCST